MARHVLRHYDICGEFHVSYRVDEPGIGKRYYCYNCWKTRFGDQLPPGPVFPEEREGVEDDNTVESARSSKEN